MKKIVFSLSVFGLFGACMVWAGLGHATAKAFKKSITQPANDGNDMPAALTSWVLASPFIPLAASSNGKCNNKNCKCDDCKCGSNCTCNDN